MNRAYSFLRLVSFVPLFALLPSGCHIKHHDDGYGAWEESGGGWDPAGEPSCRRKGTCPPGPSFDAGAAPDLRGPTPNPGPPPSIDPPPSNPSTIDAGVTPPNRPDAGVVPAPGYAGCRIDAQCGGGRCVAGDCQRPCGNDAACGTGEVCREGHCQPSPTPGGRCLYAADCGAGAACINGYCHPRCNAESACPNPADHCSANLCRPDTRPVPQCQGNNQCPATWSCVEAICRTPCTSDSQCGPGCSGTVCAGGFCVMPEELQPPPCPMRCTPTACQPSCR